MSMNFARFSRLLLLTTSLSAPMLAQAQSSILDDEVIVTAQKRSQNLDDVPIAITAYTGDQLEQLGVVESFDIAKFSPGVHIGGALAGQNTQFTIRGVNQNDFNDIVEAPNAVYVDEGYIAISQAQTFATLDIDRVEILKGPQGTLFGRNATGGLVHYITRQPNHEESEGFVKGSYTYFDTPANASSYSVEGALSGPLSENLAGRVALKFIDQGSYLQNNYPLGAVGGPPSAGAGADLGGFDQLIGRAILDYKPTDDFELRLTGAFASADLTTGPYQSIPTIAVFDANGELTDVRHVNPGETRASVGANGQDLGTDLNNDGIFGGPGELLGRFAPGGDFFGYRDPDGDDFTTSSDFAFEDHGHTDTINLNGRVIYDINDGLTLTAITDYKEYEKLLFIDVDSAPVNQSANFAGVDATSFTQEVRLNGQTETVDWVAGYYYLNIDNDSENGLKFPANGVVPGVPFDVGADASLETNSHSIFGQADVKLDDKWSFTLGGRVVFEDKDFNLAQVIHFGNPDPFTVFQGPANPAGVTLDSTSSETLWAGKAQIDYRPNDDTLFYLGVNRGVKAGSFNAPLPGGLPLPPGLDPFSYDAEVLWSYEGGFKTSLGPNTRLNGSVFYYDYNDYQAFLFTGVSGFVINADAENYGVELELQSNPVEGLDIILTGAWFDATVKDVPFRLGTGPNIITRDVNPTNSPELQATGLVRYSWAAFGGDMSAQASVNYSDEFFYNLRNFSADKFDSYVLLDARLGWDSPDGRWGAAIRVNNITDERAGIQGYDLATLCGCNEVSYQAPRSISVDLNVNF